MPSDIEKFVESLEAETTLEEVQSAETATEEATAESLVTEVDTENSKEKKIVSDEQPDKKKQFHLNVYDFVSIIMVAFIIIALIFTFVFRLVGVKGQSMESTLFENDWLITMEQDEYVYGDIVVITEPNYFNEPLIKRGHCLYVSSFTANYAISFVRCRECSFAYGFLLWIGEDARWLCNGIECGCKCQ